MKFKAWFFVFPSLWLHDVGLIYVFFNEALWVQELPIFFIPIIPIQDVQILPSLRLFLKLLKNL